MTASARNIRVNDTTFATTFHCRGPLWKLRLHWKTLVLCEGQLVKILPSSLSAVSSESFPFPQKPRVGHYYVYSNSGWNSLSSSWSLHKAKLNFVCKPFYVLVVTDPSPPRDHLKEKQESNPHDDHSRMVSAAAWPPISAEKSLLPTCFPSPVRLSWPETGMLPS